MSSGDAPMQSAAGDFRAADLRANLEKIRCEVESFGIRGLDASALALDCLVRIDRHGDLRLANPTAWRSSVRWICLMHLRSERRRHRREARVARPEGIEAADAEAEFGPFLDAIERLERLVEPRLLYGLARSLDGLALARLAPECGCSKTSLCRRLRDCRQILKAGLESKGYGPEDVSRDGPMREWLALVLGRWERGQKARPALEEATEPDSHDPDHGPFPDPRHY